MYVASFDCQLMQRLLVETQKYPVCGLYDAGDVGLLPPSRLGQICCTIPRDLPVSLVESSTGRPVARSIRLAQFTCTYGSATRTSPVARSIVYANPFLLNATSTFRR